MELKDLIDSKYVEIEVDRNDNLLIDFNCIEIDFHTTNENDKTLNLNKK